MASAPQQEINGILLVDKEPDWTSHDVVNCIRGRFKIKKVGHCGTLDPMATGLLIVVLGKATKLAETYAGEAKTYMATLKLGVVTNTQDITGTITEEHDVSGISAEKIQNVFNQFLGQQQQIPPMVSAIKIHGQPLYKLARKGKTVEREPRTIIIHDLTIHDIRENEVDFSVTCSKGTYVRTLCDDIGKALGCGGCMASLRRTHSGSFEITEKVKTISEIKAMDIEDFKALVQPLTTESR